MIREKLFYTIDHGSAAVAPVVTPDTGYNFTAWDVAFSNITEDLTVVAQYEIISYSVGFDPAEGTYVSGELVQTIEHGSAAIEPVVQAPSNYQFIGWDLSIDAVTEDLITVAQYEFIGPPPLAEFDFVNGLQFTGMTAVTLPVELLGTSSPDAALVYALATTTKKKNKKYSYKNANLALSEFNKISVSLKAGMLLAEEGEIRIKIQLIMDTGQKLNKWLDLNISDLQMQELYHEFTVPVDASALKEINIVTQQLIFPMTVQAIYLTDLTITEIVDPNN